MSENVNTRDAYPSVFTSPVFWAVFIALILGILAWGRLTNVRTYDFVVTPRSGDAQVDVNVQLGEGIVDIAGGADDDALFEAAIATTGLAELNTERTGDRVTVDLTYTRPSWLVNTLFGRSYAQRHWDIFLTETMPLALNVDGGIGGISLNLDDVQLTALNIDGGVGDLDIHLPAPPERYTVAIGGGLGDLAVSIPDGAALNFELDGSLGDGDIVLGEAVDADITLNTGAGDIDITVAAGAAVRVTVDAGFGDVDLPARLQELGGGVYESSGFAEAEAQVTIAYDGSLGDFRVLEAAE